MKQFWKIIANYQWGVAITEKKRFSRQHNPYFFIFVQEKWKYKISKGVAVAESPTGESATETIVYANE